MICLVDCLEGEQKVKMLESRFSNGHTIIEMIPRCTPCPLNTYQDELGGAMCILCPQNSFTFSTGSKSQDECIGRFKSHIAVSLLCIV